MADGPGVLAALGEAAAIGQVPEGGGLAVDGEEGVKSVLDMLRDELEATMDICGRSTIDSIDLDTLGASDRGRPGLEDPDLVAPPLQLTPDLQWGPLFHIDVPL